MLRQNLLHRLVIGLLRKRLWAAALGIRCLLRWLLRRLKSDLLSIKDIVTNLIFIIVNAKSSDHTLGKLVRVLELVRRRRAF